MEALKPVAHITTLTRRTLEKHGHVENNGAAEMQNTLATSTPMSQVNANLTTRTWANRANSTTVHHIELLQPRERHHGSPFGPGPTLQT